MGITSYDFLEYFSQFLLILALAFLLIIIGIILYLVPSIRDKIKDKLVKVYLKMKWNGTIRSLTVSYLKIAIFISLKIQNEFPSLKKSNKK